MSLAHGVGRLNFWTQVSTLGLANSRDDVIYDDLQRRGLERRGSSVSAPLRGSHDHEFE